MIAWQNTAATQAPNMATWGAGGGQKEFWLSLSWGRAGMEGRKTARVRYLKNLKEMGDKNGQYSGYEVLRW